MQGLEISKKYYYEYGKQMLENEFSDVIDRIAVGLAGEGSECFGFDDEISYDHDFEAGFCLWINEEDYERFGFRLEKAYSKLPSEFMGLKKSRLSPVGGSRHGVITTEAFYSKFLGESTVPDCIERWLYIPPQAFASACNGEVFRDPLGAFSAVRNVLLAGYPDDIRKKKIAAHTVIMAQAGQYNYLRCVKRGDTGAAQLAVFEFVKHAISTVYLLNNKYEPFYKWAYRGMRGLPILGNIGELLSAITELDNSQSNFEIKNEAIEDISERLIYEFKSQSLSNAEGCDLEKHAYSVQSSIKDNRLRNMHIMEGAT